LVLVIASFTKRKKKESLQFCGISGTHFLKTIQNEKPGNPLYQEGN